MLRRHIPVSVAFVVMLAASGHAPQVQAADPPTVAFARTANSVRITVARRPLATYVYRDDKIPRPYFAYVHAPCGAQVTRNHPPIEGRDPTDHATYHPGIWLAFGDLGGADFWRNHAKVVHEKFIAQPAGGAGKGSFVVGNRYVSADGERTICREVCRYTILVRPSGHLLICDSQFASEQADFYFGDQEEMGLGVRVATPITAKRGGEITNSEGRRNEEQVWGRQADWCDYSGNINGRRVGVMLMPDPKSFRRSWFHGRDYGLLVANAFGRDAFNHGEKSKVLVKKGERFRLRFGVLLHSHTPDEPLDRPAAYQDFLARIATPHK